MHLNVNRLSQFSIALAMLLVSSFALPAQSFEQVEHENNDCRYAIQIMDTLYGPFAATDGSGQVEDIIEEDRQSVYFFTKERNTAWYTFEATHHANLSMAITPVNEDDDINFLLFKVDTVDFCKVIQQCLRLPLRSNMSRVDPEWKGMTGMRPEGTETHIGSGRGDAFTKDIQVKRGEVYMLVLDHRTSKENGHSIYLRYDPPFSEEFETDKPSVYEKRMGRLERDHVLKVEVTNKITKKPMMVDFYLEKDEEGTVFRAPGTSEMKYNLAAFSSYILKVEMKGYLIYSNEIRTQNQNGEIDLSLSFDEILESNSFNLNNVKFRKNETNILSSSTDELMTLKNFMDLNPTVNIEIVGHVNAPDMDNSMKIQRISRERAKAVFQFLVNHGIERKRMTYEGKGNTEMIYPFAESKEEKQANRRVEIIIR